MHKMYKFLPIRITSVLKRPLHVNCAKFVRVRFAPSPTGYLHVGGLRTALVNKLFAVKHNGKFILRIEDTDQTRFFPDSLQDIRSSLHWAGLEVDEGPDIGGNYGPYFQSQRKALYQQIAEQLVSEGLAYRCFCSTGRLALMRNEQSRRGEKPRYDNRCRNLTSADITKHLSAGDQYTIRFKVPSSAVTVTDMVYGESIFDKQDSEGDFIIVKSDGMPVYHLANVCDDHFMEISHVIRGMEWLSSTPKHLMLYQALDWTPPKFMHLPLLLSSSGGKLSKRSPEFALVGQVRSLIAAGYLPSAVLTWLCSVGFGVELASSDSASAVNWNPAMQFSDLVSWFNTDLLGRQNVQLSPDVLQWCSRTHFDQLAKDALMACQHSEGYQTPELLHRVRAFFAAHDMPLDEQDTTPHPQERDRQLAEQLNALRGRITKLSDLTDEKQGTAFIWKPVQLTDIRDQLTQTLGEQDLPTDLLKRFLNDLLSCLAKCTNADQLGSHLRAASNHCGIRYPVAMRLLRLMLCGHQAGLPVTEIVQTLTIKASFDRLSKLRQELSDTEWTGTQTESSSINSL